MKRLDLDDLPPKLAALLVGLEEGAEVKIAIPAGTKRFEVLELVTIHDREK